MMCMRTGAGRRQISRPSLRPCRTKNISGSICSVTYWVYLKHATGPTFLNLWKRIKWSPEMRNWENPQRIGSKQPERMHFHTVVTHHLICFHGDSPSPSCSPPPMFPYTDWSSSASPKTQFPLPSGSGSTIQNHHPPTTDLLRFGMCV